MFQKLVSLSTGFLTFCLFNATVFLLSFIGTLLGSHLSESANIAWLAAMAFTPTIWIIKNKNMMKKIKQMTGCLLVE